MDVNLSAISRVLLLLQSLDNIRNLTFPEDNLQQQKTPLWMVTVFLYRETPVLPMKIDETCVYQVSLFNHNFLQEPATTATTTGCRSQACLFSRHLWSDGPQRAAHRCTRLWSRAAAEIVTTASCSSACAAVDRNGPGVSTSPLSRRDDQGPARRSTGTEVCKHRVLRAFCGLCEGFPATLSG